MPVHVNIAEKDWADDSGIHIDGKNKLTACITRNERKL